MNSYLNCKDFFPWKYNYFNKTINGKKITINKGVKSVIKNRFKLLKVPRARGTLFRQCSTFTGIILVFGVF